MSKCFRVLSIDGGGIRGILPGQILVELEKKLQKYANDSKVRIADYFDFFSGTSTGGILTCLYLCPDSKNNNRPLYSAQDAVNLYLKNGNQIFKRDLEQKIFSANGLLKEKYNGSIFEDLLKEYFKKLKLSELLKPCLIPSYNIFQRDTHFFTQHDAKRTDSYDYYLYDVARGTSAAPTYFEPARVTSISGVSYPVVDGGVFANNPALCAYAEVCEHFKEENRSLTAADLFIVSIGTGSKKQSYDYDKAKGWGELGWVQPVMDIMMSGASETIDFQLKKIFGSANKSENYYRISPDIGEADTAMDNASSVNLNALKEAGIASAEKYDKDLEEIAHFLVNKSEQLELYTVQR
ncbi:MAG: patatin-like phospholipase family protein [Bacteroidia bacterium]